MVTLASVALDCVTVIVAFRAAPRAELSAELSTCSTAASRSLILPPLPELPLKALTMVPSSATAVVAMVTVNVRPERLRARRVVGHGVGKEINAWSTPYCSASDALTAL